LRREKEKKVKNRERKERGGKVRKGGRGRCEREVKRRILRFTF